jgi:hypothetical protein
MSWKLLFVPLLLATGVVVAGDVPEAEKGAGDTQAPARTAETDRGPLEAKEVAADDDARVPAARADEDIPEAEKVAAETEAGVRKAVTDDDVPEAEKGAGDTQAPARTADDPKLISGMSILGNQEAPKSLVIVPWKSSEIGDSLGISTMLDDSRQPIDRDVFMRELSYYEIRSEGTP